MLAHKFISLSVQGNNESILGDLTLKAAEAVAGNVPPFFRDDALKCARVDLSRATASEERKRDHDGTVSSYERIATSRGHCSRNLDDRASSFGRPEGDVIARQNRVAEKRRDDPIVVAVTQERSAFLQRPFPSRSTLGRLRKDGLMTQPMSRRRPDLDCSQLRHSYLTATFRLPASYYD